MESMRAVGYSIETALADIVDNSIAANASAISLDFVGQPKPQILILDNGEGMTRDEIRVGMRLAGKPPSTARAKTDLGRFGLGLKTASFSQAKRLTIISKPKGGQLNCAIWDLDTVEEENKWLLEWVDPETIESGVVDRLRKQESGTLVIWEKLDQVSSSKSNFDSELRDQASRVGDHLGLVFHRFIDAPPNSRIAFTLNGSSIHAIDPFFSKLQATQRKPTTAVELANGTIKVTPFILPHISQLSKADAKALESMRSRFKDSQGFYVYRGRRLISYGSWFRLAPKTELAKMARVRVDTPNSLDKDWKLGIMKSSVEPPPELRKVLSNLVPSIIGDSRRVVMRKGGKTAVAGTSSWHFREIGPQIFALEINRDHPLLVSLLSGLTGEQLSIFDLFVTQLEAGVPTGELVSRLSSDQALESSSASEEELQQMATKLFRSLRSLYPSTSDTIEALYKLEPFSSDPFSREKLDGWRDELINEVPND